MEFKLLPDEYWWGGTIRFAEKMPIGADDYFKSDILRDKWTQTAPLFLSSKGRYLWSEEPFIITFDHGNVTVEGDYPIELTEGGSTLRDAYISAMNAHFPFAEGIHTPREFYEHPQFNTWMELIKNQNQTDIVKYAREIVEHGYTPGILMIDGGWQKAQGVWQFNHDLIQDPKAMVDELHKLGFIVLIWVSPFVCPEGNPYMSYIAPRSSEDVAGTQHCDHLLHTKDGDVAIQQWWSGFGAIHNFTSEADRAHMGDQLDFMMKEYGFDGFKFDGGSYNPQAFVNGTDFYGGVSLTELNIAWIDFAASYKFHEVKDTWKQCGKPVIQRLHDKNHSWSDNGLDCLIPHGIFTGLIGCPFICPDMVGGGEWTAFVYGKHDEELFLRMAECSALFPMMQFSSLPWRHLSENAQKVCREMALLHERMYPEIEAILTNTEKTGEPIIRSMEYMFPGNGYEKVNDQFMLGEDILVAPVIVKGEVVKAVRLPEGDWEDQNDGKVYHGGVTVNVPAPVERLPWFRRK